MMQGEGDVVTGWRNKLQTTMANVTPSAMRAERHRTIAEPGSGKPWAAAGCPCRPVSRAREAGRT